MSLPPLSMNEIVNTQKSKYINCKWHTTMYTRKYRRPGERHIHVSHNQKLGLIRVRWWECYKCYCGFKMGTRTWIGTELHGDSDDDTEQSNINSNKTKEVGSSASSSNEATCYLATRVATIPLTSPHRTRTTRLLVKFASKLHEDPLWRPPLGQYSNVQTLRKDFLFDTTSSWCSGIWMYHLMICRYWAPTT